MPEGSVGQAKYAICNRVNLRFSKSDIAFWLLMLGLMAYLLWPKFQGAAIKEGAPIPETVLRPLSGGEPIAITSNGGTIPGVVVLNFWTTWCPSCKSEIPDLKAVKSWMQNGEEIYGVSLDQAPDATVKEFVSRYPFNFPVVRIHDQTPWNVTLLPTTYVINKHGKVSESFTGSVSASRLKAAIKHARGE